MGVLALTLLAGMRRVTNAAIDAAERDAATQPHRTAPSTTESGHR